MAIFSQIRRHCAILGHPIVGDLRYGAISHDAPPQDLEVDADVEGQDLSLEPGKCTVAPEADAERPDDTRATRLYLWASSLRLHHPISGQALFFESCVPSSFLKWFYNDKP